MKVYQRPKTSTGSSGCRNPAGTGTGTGGCRVGGICRVGGTVKDNCDVTEENGGDVKPRRHLTQSAKGCRKLEDCPVTRMSPFCPAHLAPSRRPPAPIDAWSVEDPAIRQLYCGARRRYFPGQQCIALKSEGRLEGGEEGQRTPVGGVERNITGQGRRSSMAHLVFLNERSFKAKDKAGARLQELNRDVAGVVIRQPNKRLQKVLEMPQQKHWETTALDKAGEAQGEGIRLGEFISQVVGQLLKQGHVEVPDPMRPPLIARLSDAIIDEAADWDVAEADSVIVKIREMLEREALKRILAEYGVQISREMLQVGDQLRAAAAGKQRRGSLQLQRKKSQSTEDEKIDASEFESDSLLNVSEFTESELPASGGDHDDKDTFDNLRSDEAFYSARSDLFFSTGPQKGRLLRGSLEDLPHAQKRVVRVYLCSNFSDMIDERSWILRTAVPKLQEFARQSNLDFLLVDLRWGVSEESAYEPENLPVYFEQIEYCRRLSSGAFFVVLLGNKYGHADLPMTLPVRLFQSFEKVWASLKILHADLVQEWYQLDENAVPPVYCLQPVSSKIASYGIMEYGIYNEQLRKSAARQWFKMEQNMRETIDRTLLMSQDQGIVASEVVELLAKSELEKEVHHAMNTLQARYCICYARHIDGLEFHIDDELAPTFIDIIERNQQRVVDRAKQRRIEALKQNLERVKETLVKKQRRRGNMARSWSHAEYDDSERSSKDLNTIIARQEAKGFEDPLYLQQYVIDWEENTDSKTLTAEQKAFLKAENEIYLEQLTKDFVHDCKEMIATFALDKFRTSKIVNYIEEEVVQQAKICNDLTAYCCPGVYDLEGVKTRLDFCIDHGCPLIVHGDTGSGMSTLVALINSNLRNWYGTGIVNVVRFVGATPASMNVPDILTMLGRQLSEVFETPTPKHAIEHVDLNAYFIRILRNAASHLGESGMLFILLDGLDNLKPDEDNSHCLSWLPKTYPPRVQLVLSTSAQSHVIMRNLRNAFKVSRSYIEVQTMRKKSAELMIQLLLDRKNRTLTSEQMAIVLQQISGCPKPFFVSLLMQHAVEWKSTLDMRQYKVPENVEMAIIQIFVRLESKLGTSFVRNAVTMLAISDGGLSELEWEDALACDDEVLDEAFQYKDPPTTVIRCPQLFIARLRYHLGQLLLLRDDHGLPVYYWSNTAIESAIYKCYLMTGADSKHTEIYHHCHRVLADLFHAEGPVARTLYLRKRKMTIENANRQTAVRRLTPGNRRKLQKLPTFIYRSASEESILQEYKEKIVCNMNWLLTKLRGRPYGELLKDFDIVRQKDDDVLVIYGILQTEAEAIKEHPEILQLEILSRFSKIRKANSVCIDRMVASSRALLTTTTLTLLYPFYPCVPTVDLSLRLSKPGPTHLLGVYDREFAVIWGPECGLEIWQLAPVHRIIYHLCNAPNLSDAILSPDCSLVFCVESVTLYKWTVSSGTLIGECDLVKPPPPGSDAPPSGLGLLSPLVADRTNTRVVVRANVREAQLDSCGLILVNSEEMVVTGSILEMSYGSEITNSEFYEGNLFVTQTRVAVSGKLVNRVLLFSQLPSRTVTAVINLPPRLRDVPGCFQGLADRNRLYLGCLSDSDEWEKLECEIGIGTVSRKMVGLKITDVGLVIVLFACVSEEGYSVLAVLDAQGRHRAHSVSKSGLASCLELTNDHANVFVGYRSVGVVEVYDLPEATLAHTFRAHAGDVNCIREVDTWQVYTTGSDATFRFFDLSVTSLAMDFTKKSPRRFDDDSVLTDEDVFARRSIGVRSVDMSRSEHTLYRMVICYDSQNPVIAELYTKFACHPLQMPSDIAEVHCAWFAVDDTLVIGLASPKEPNKASGSSKIVLTWNAYNRQIVERETIYADDCCLSRDGQSIALLRRRKNGTSMAVFRLKENEKVRKYRSARTVDAGVRLLSDDCRYLMSIEPHENCIVVWKLLPRDIESQEEDYTALSESEPCDDGTCSDTAYDYDERSPQRRMSRIQQEMMLKTIVERENEYNLFDDFTLPYRAQSRYYRKTRFMLRIHANVEAVVVNRNDTLMVGNNQGHVLFFYLNQMADGIHNFYSALPLHDREITAITLTINERYILTGSKDNKIKIYDLWENETQSTLNGHTNAVQCISVSSRNQFVVSGSKDNTIRLWNLVTGRRLTTFCACMEIYSVVMFRQRGDQLKVLALADKKGRKRLMLFRALNLVTTNKRENF